MGMIHNFNRIDKLRNLAIVLCLLPACQRSEFQTQAKSGLNDFNQSVERAYGRLAKGGIRKKDGFYNECSVEFSTETGIRVSQSVCDEGVDMVNVTIRVTDPATRPPSQRQNTISVHLTEVGQTKLMRDHTESFPN